MIAGVATDTIVVSTRIMKNPMTRAHRAGHGLLVADLLVPSGAGADRVGAVGGLPLVDDHASETPW